MYTFSKHSALQICGLVWNASEWDFLTLFFIVNQMEIINFKAQLL